MAPTAREVEVVTYDRRNIGLAKRWAGCKVRIVPVGKVIHVYYGKILLRSVTFDPGVRVFPERTMARRQRSLQPRLAAVASPFSKGSA
jgi:hypothetical protein